MTTHGERHSVQPEPPTTPPVGLPPEPPPFGVDFSQLEAAIDQACTEIQALGVLNAELVAALKEARVELEMVFHKFARAGGIGAVAERGVPLGAMSWASNVENGLIGTLAVLDAAISKAEAR